MHYCKWRTLNENARDDIQFIYRLPTIIEWLNANDYLNSTKIPNDFNKNYSDWTLNAMDDVYFSFESYQLEYLYFHKKDDTKALTRKTVAGNSFLYRQSSYFYGNPPLDHFSYYAAEGYRQISFRIIKDSLDTKESGSGDIAGQGKIAQRVLEYWGINSKNGE